MTHSPHGDSADPNSGPSGLVINELLCFVVNKSECLPPEAICQLCLSSFAEDEIEKAKKMLYELCTDKSIPRMVTRKGPKKMAQNMDDIVKFIHDKGSDLPTFVARDLQLLPPVTFNSLDVSSLLHTIKQTQAEVSLLKEGLNIQAQSICDLQTVVSEQAATRVQGHQGLSRETAPTAPREAAATKTEAALTSAGSNAAESANADHASEKSEDQKHAGAASEQAAKVNATLNPADEWKKMTKVNGKVRAVPMNSKFQTVSASSNRKTRPATKGYVSGSVKESGLTTVKKVIKSKYASVFASRFDTSVSCEMLKKYLEERLNLKVDVSPVKTRYDTYHSFHVMAECENPKVFIDDSVWPEGAYVRWWKGSFVGQEGTSSKSN